MNDNETFYDEHIAPELLRLAKLCKDRGMAFAASVEYDPPNAGIGFTESCPPGGCGVDVSSSQMLSHWSGRSKGNVDVLISAIDKNARKHGHSSVYLTQIGNKNVRYSLGEFAATAIAKD